VIEPRIDDGAESLAEAGGVQCVCDAEIQPSGYFGRESGPFRIGLDDGFVDEIDPERLDSAIGHVNGQIA
jgi:hypothetical protein